MVAQQKGASDQTWPRPVLSWWPLSLRPSGPKLGAGAFWPCCAASERHPFPPQLYAKLQAVKAEIQDQHDEYIRVRQDLEEAQNEQTRELKLK